MRAITPSSSSLRNHRAAMAEKRPVLPLVLAGLLALVCLSVALEDEPLHIDELRQAGYYDRGFGAIVDGAFSQEQPPLDYLLGAGVEAILGPSDFARRLPAVVAGLAALAMLGLLVRRSDRSGWLAAILLALSPVYLEFTAYARPYALPLALMVAFLFAANYWKVSANPWVLALCFVVAILLPLSRTTEPPLFLGGTLATFGVLRWWRGREFNWVTGPAIAAFVGVLSALPVLGRVSGQTAEFQSDGINGVGVIVNRLVSDIAPVYLGELWFGWLLVAVALVGLGYGCWLFLKDHGDLWWILPLGFIALGMPVVFAALADPAQPYWPRYTYYFMPLFGVAGALLAGALKKPLGAVFMAFLVGIGLIGTMTSLNTTTNPDYRDAGERAFETADDDGDFVIWEFNRSLEEWRPTVFPGTPLYVPWSANFNGVEIVARGDAVLEEGRRPLVLAQSFAGPPEGWTGIPITKGFAMWIPERQPTNWDFREQAEALWSVCLGLPPDVGAAMCASAVRTLAAGGDNAGAIGLLELTETRIESNSVRGQLRNWLADLDTATRDVNLSVRSDGLNVPS